MSDEPVKSASPRTLRGDDLAPAIQALDELYQRARKRVLDHVTEAGRISARLLDRHQLAAHALAYLATELEAARQLVRWSERVHGELEQAIAGAYVGELCRALVGGVDLGPCESIALGQMWLEHDDVRDTLLTPQVQAVAERYASGDALCEIARMAHSQRSYGALGLGDDTLAAVQSEFRRFVESEVTPIAQEIHRKDKLIPLDLLEKMAELGVFGANLFSALGAADGARVGADDRGGRDRGGGADDLRDGAAARARGDGGRDHAAHAGDGAGARCCIAQRPARPPRRGGERADAGRGVVGGVDERAFRRSGPKREGGSAGRQCPRKRRGTSLKTVT